MDSIGKYLRERRLLLNLTIDDISRSTRLRKSTLQQIEEDDFEAIGDVGFIKVMVITFCRAVSGEEEQVKKKLNLIFNKPTALPIKITTAKNVKPVILSLNIFYFFFLSILTIVLTIAIWTIYKRGTFPTFNEIKTQIYSKEKKVAKQIIADDLEPDSLWVYQRNIYQNTINSNNEKKSNLTFDPQDKVSGDHNIKMSHVTNSFINDKTDYVGELIFNNIENPLNPKINE